MKRRQFIKLLLRCCSVATLGAIGVFTILKPKKDRYVWQIDTAKCTQCGRCRTHCVLSISAVKCVHSFESCGYCNLCGGYIRPNAKELNTAAENRLCPTDAIKRKYIEDPYFEYTINEDLCVGCAKCVKGCSAFGNSSLNLQIRYDRCKNCNECAIAVACPANAIKRVLT